MQRSGLYHAILQSADVSLVLSRNDKLMLFLAGETQAPDESGRSFAFGWFAAQENLIDVLLGR